MTPVLGLDAATTAWVILGGSTVLILVFLVFNPWRTVRDEPPIPEEAETRLLLRQDFDAIDEAMQASSDETASADSEGASHAHSDDAFLDEWEALKKVSQSDISERDE